MKRLLAKSILLAGGMTVSSQLLALGLGEMNLDSALNQPLRADIVLIDTTGLSIAEMKPKLASADDFERAGVERYQFLTQMKFSVNGDRIVVTTRDPINEPFLNFLVELNWPSGRVLREYTVLLDPPVFEEGRVQPLVAVPAGAITSTTTVTTQPPRTAPVSINTAAQNNPWSQPAAPGEYKVQPEDTLWQIALDTRPNRSISPQQMMVALQDVNPNAFINGNINRLKTHTVLVIPDESIVDTISDNEAVVEVQRQNRELTTASTAQIDATGRSADKAGPSKTTGGGEVRLLSSKAEGQSKQAGGSVSGSAGNTSATEDDLSIALENLDKSQRENQELVDRLSALEQQLAKMERLITLQSDQMASMAAGVTNKTAAQTQVAQTTAAKTPVTNPDGTAAAATTPEAPLATAEVTAADDATETSQATADGQQAAADKPVAGTAQPQDGSETTDYNYTEEAPTEETTSGEATQAADQISEEQRVEQAALLAMKERAEADAKSPVDKFIATVITTPIEYIAIGLGGLLVLISALFFMRKRKKDEEQAFEDVMADDTIVTDLDDDNLNGFELPDDLDDNTGFAAAASGSTLDSFDLNESDLGAMPVSDDLDDLDLDGYDDGEGDQYETVGQTEDAISESDIYIAYGKFDQAVELLNGAIAAEPDRVDLRLKHLEILSSLDDNEAFSKAEGNLNALGDEDANKQAEELRVQLSSPIAPTVSDDHVALSLDGEIPSLDESAESDFDDGMDFGEALDFGDDVAPEDDGIGSTLETVPELELGESSDFDAHNEGVDMSLEDDIVKLDDNLLAFDLDDDDDEDSLDKIDAIETDIPLEGLDDKRNDSALESFDFDLESKPVQADVADVEVNIDDDLEELTFELPSMDSEDENSLNLDEAPAVLDGELLDLADLSDEAEDHIDFDVTPVLGTSSDSSEALDELLDTDDIDLELADGELQVDLPEDDVEASITSDLEELALDDNDSALDLDVAGLDSTLLDSRLEEQSAITEAAGEKIEESLDLEDLLAEPMVVAVEEPFIVDAGDDPFADLEDLMSSDAEDLAENSDLIGGIDLDELAAADDEFDFLAGTDECATKLDLARAYVDMEDSDGARELLQEVVQEGNDEQRSEAKDMMDKLS